MLQLPTRWKELGLDQRLFDLRQEVDDGITDTRPHIYYVIAIGQLAKIPGLIPTGFSAVLSDKQASSRAAVQDAVHQAEASWQKGDDALR